MATKTFTDDAGYQAATNKLEQLQKQRAEVDAELTAAAAQKRENLSARDRAALAMLDGDQPADDTSRAELIERRAVIDRAIELQRNAVETERARVSRDICAAALPTHKRNVKAVSAALAALADAVAAEEQLREKLDGGGVVFGATIRPMGLCARINCAADVAELATAYSNEAAEYGLA